MKNLVAGLALALGSSLVAAQPAKPKAEPVVDHAAIAERIVSTTANVKEGDIVEITAGPADLALLEELTVAVRKRGGYPLPVYNSEAITRKVIATMPAKYDTQVAKLQLELTKLVNVHIFIPAVRDPKIFDALPADRQAKWAKTNQPVDELVRKRNVRFIELGNGLSPSPTRAKQLGVSEAELAKLFWDGIGADYTAVAAKCKALQDALAAGTEVQITHANGTALKLKIKGKKPLANDGMVSDAEIKAGGPAVQAWLPAGEVYVVPAGGDGKLVDDRMLFEGNEVTGVTLELKAGKVTAIDAKAGWDKVKPRYDIAGPGKTELGVLDFGCNTAIKSNPKLETWMGAGMVTILVGGNVWAGGSNKEPFGIVYQLADATVTIDGKPLIDNGTLK